MINPRMWMINPRMLCRKHLLEEHGDIHKHRHNFVKKHNMSGRKGQIFPLLMKERHDLLAEEMLRRGYEHESPYEQPDVSYLPGDVLTCIPDIDWNIKDLSSRCDECAGRIKQEKLPYKADIEKTLKQIGMLTDKLVAYGSEISDNFKVILRGGSWELTVRRRGINDKKEKQNL